jgi:hypothetical protein
MRRAMPVAARRVLQPVLCSSAEEGTGTFIVRLAMIVAKVWSDNLWRSWAPARQAIVAIVLNLPSSCFAGRSAGIPLGMVTLRKGRYAL